MENILITEYLIILTRKKSRKCIYSFWPDAIAYAVGSKILCSYICVPLLYACLCMYVDNQEYKIHSAQCHNYGDICITEIRNGV